MAEIGSGNGSGYPGALDTDSTQESSSTLARADVPNDLAAAIIAVQTELGTDPAGSLTDVVTYLQTEHNANGTHSTVTVSGTLTVTGASTLVATVIDGDGVTLAAGDDLIGSASSDITFNTDKFTVAGATGNTVVGGTLTVDGASTLTGAVTLTAGISSFVYLSGAGTEAGVTDGSGIIQIGNDSGANIGIDGDEIQARSAEAKSVLNINPSGGEVVVGEAALVQTMTLRGTAQPSAADGSGALQIGADGGANIGIGSSKLQARDGAGAVATMDIQPIGGNIILGASGSGVVFIHSTASDVTASDGSGHLQVGPNGGINLGIDTNEIQCRSGASGSTLSIQSAGGDVTFGDSTHTATTTFSVFDDKWEVVFGAGNGTGFYFKSENAATADDIHFHLVDADTASARKTFVVQSNNGSTECMTILADGNVGINDTSPAVKLAVGGSITAVNGTFSGGVDTVADQGGGTRLKMKVVDIGDWNMDSSGAGSTSKSTAHGLTLSTIRSVEVNIRNDGGTSLTPLDNSNNFTEVDGEWTVGATNVDMNHRGAACQFDTSDFDATSYNRGWITIWYTA